MATKKKKFISPFIYNTFQPTNNKSVNAVYQERIINLYYKQYPVLNDFTMDQIQKELEKKQKKILQKKIQDQIDKDKKDKNDKKDDDNDDDDNKDIDNKDKDQDINKDQNKDNKDNKDDDKDDKDKNKDNKDDLKDNNPSADADPPPLSLEKKKLLNALFTLENDYYGNEHTFYLYLCNKYNVNLILSEYKCLQYFPPSIRDIYREQCMNIKCFECDEYFNYLDFTAAELLNGYFIACAKCSPDRDSVISCKWSTVYKSGEVQIQNNSLVATVRGSRHRYACIDSRNGGVRKGIHCWRWKTTKYRSWFLWGIGHIQKYRDNSYSERGVFGIAGSNQAYVDGRHRRGVNTRHFYGKESILIDMKLDFNKGELLFCICGDKEKRIVKLDGIPKNDPKPFAPHINIYYENATCQIKKLPPSWFGKNPARVKFQY